MTSGNPVGSEDLAAPGWLPREFGRSLEFLSSGFLVAPAGFLASACQIVRKAADRQWVLDHGDRTGFKVSETKAEVALSESSLTSVLAASESKLKTSKNAVVRAALHQLGDGDSLRSFVSASIVRLFLAHEFFHVTQGLGSSQYEDSDGYGSCIAPIDYQADVVSIYYVFEGYQSEGFPLERRPLLLLLVCIHICVMQAFAPSSASMELDPASFDRILVWHYQAARIAASEDAPDFTHPSILQMPTIVLPAVRSPLGADVRAEGTNFESEARQDLVIAATSPDGVARLTRLRSTSPDRVKRLVAALLAEDAAGVMDEFDELFRSNQAILSFEPDGKMRRLVRRLREAAELADSILDGDGGREPLGPESLPVIMFFDRITMLLQAGNLTGAAWQEYAIDAERDPTGLLAQRLNRLPSTGRRRTRLPIEHRIRSEIERLRLRLATTLDELETIT